MLRTCTLGYAPETCPGNLYQRLREVRPGLPNWKHWVPLTIQTTSKPAIKITRTAFDSTELCYVAVANKAIKYQLGASKIVYIGTTKSGADRIAASAAAKAGEMLGIHGVTHLEFFVVTSSKKSSVKTWHKLERGLLLTFKDVFGEPPKCNKVGKGMKWTDELEYFTEARLRSVIEKYSKPGPLE